MTETNASATIQRLQTDAPFALQFAVANNPQGIIDALSARGIVPSSAVQNKTDWAYNTLYKMLSINKPLAIEIVTGVPYVINSKATWTNGFDSFFTDYQRKMNQGSNVGAKFSVEALLGGLGAGLGTYAGIATTADAPTGYTPTTQQLEAEKLQAEADKNKKTMIIAGSIIGAILLIIVLVVVFKKKKTA